ncbi:MAG: GNAT family N-acetyltransferase [Clostridia bacterium]|nr:GNAT family N-acetyltransferase [Clostridia bacterium]
MIQVIPVRNDEVIILEELANAIWRECYTTLLGIEQVEYMVKKFQSKDAFVEQIDSGYEYYFLDVDGAKAGYLGICQEGNKLFLSKLYLKESFHGMGLAQKVLKIVVNIAIERGLDSIYLTVNKGNVKAIRAYERFGFIKTDSIVTDIGNGFVMDDFVYSYPIK